MLPLPQAFIVKLESALKHFSPRSMHISGDMNKTGVQIDARYSNGFGALGSMGC